VATLADILMHYNLFVDMKAKIVTIDVCIKSIDSRK